MMPSVLGELTLEEFITGAKEQPDIMEMLTKILMYWRS